MSDLKIQCEYKNNRTIISSLYFTSPLKVAKPFYGSGENPWTKIMVMQASAGLLEKDVNNIEIICGENSSLEFTGQSFTKVFSSPEGIGSRQNFKIELKENASLVDTPLPIVPFENSVYKGETKIHLAKNSRLFYSDIFCCGRKERGEEFKFKSYISRCRIYIEDKLKFMDNSRLIPENFSLKDIGLFEGFSHSGFIYNYGFEIPENLETFSDKVVFAQSQCLEGTVIRMFSNDAESLRIFINQLGEFCMNQKK